MNTLFRASILGLLCVGYLYSSVADAQIFRRGFRRQQRRCHDLTVASIAVLQRKQEVVSTLELLPDYTRAIMVAEGPIQVPAQRTRVEYVDRRKAIEVLDPNPGIAFSQYLKFSVMASFLANMPDEMVDSVFEPVIHLAIKGTANHFLPSRGPAPVTETDDVLVLVYEKDFSGHWDDIRKKLSNIGKNVSHDDQGSEFFLYGRLHIGFQAPCTIIVGTKRDYFLDTLKGFSHAPIAASRANQPATFMDLIDPAASVWLAYFPDNRGSIPSHRWPVHVLDYSPNSDWNVRIWSKGEDVFGDKVPPEAIGKEWKLEIVPAQAGYPSAFAYWRVTSTGMVEQRIPIRNAKLLIEGGYWPILQEGFLGRTFFF